MLAHSISGAFKIIPKVDAKRMHDFIKPNKIKGFNVLRYSTPTSPFGKASGRFGGVSPLFTQHSLNHHGEVGPDEALAKARLAPTKL